MNTILAVDPGTHYTGYAKLDEGGLSYGLIKAGGNNWIDRCERVAHACHSLGPTHNLVIEWPQFQPGRRGLAAARGGDTLKLAFLCGAIFGRTPNHNIHLITPAEWKGSLPKRVTASRCQREYGLSGRQEIDNNWIDAVMLASWFSLTKLGRELKPERFVRRDY